MQTKSVLIEFTNEINTMTHTPDERGEREIKKLSSRYDVEDGNVEAWIETHQEKINEIIDFLKSRPAPEMGTKIIQDWLRKAPTEAYQAGIGVGKIQARHLLEDLYAKAEDKAELIEMFNEALQDNKK